MRIHISMLYQLLSKLDAHPFKLCTFDRPVMTSLRLSTDLLPYWVPGFPAPPTLRPAMEASYDLQGEVKGLCPKLRDMSVGSSVAAVPKASQAQHKPTY